MGGKKKASKPPLKKDSKFKIPAMYNCPLCDAKAAIVIKINKSVKFAFVRCRFCNAQLSDVPCCHLETKVDVFHKFREHVLEKDKEYLRAQNIQTARTKPLEGLNVLVDVEDSDDRLDALSFGSLLAAESSMEERQDTTARIADRKRPKGLEALEDEDDNDLGHHFATEPVEEDLDD